MSATNNFFFSVYYIFLFLDKKCLKTMQCITWKISFFFTADHWITDDEDHHLLHCPFNSMRKVTLVKSLRLLRVQDDQGGQNISLLIHKNPVFIVVSFITFKLEYINVSKKLKKILFPIPNI